MNLQISYLLKSVLVLATFFVSLEISAQENDKKALREAEEHLQEAEDALSENDFASAEASYRKAIAKDPENPTARYNLGNLYYNKEKNSEAGQRLNQAGNIAGSKAEKHKAFHNLGNSFMKDKNYEQAVEAYKNALRNNPTDDETRYNLALAKKMMEQEQEDQEDDGGGDDDQEQDENEDQEQDQEQDQQDQGGDGENEGEPEDEGENEENEGEGDQEEEEQDGEGDQEQEEDGEGDEQEQPQPQPQQGQLSPEQIKSLLEAMNNEERKVQDKINAEKAKGAKVKSEKDW